MFVSSQELLTREGEAKNQKSLDNLFPTVQWLGVVIVGGVFMGAFFPKQVLSSSQVESSEFITAAGLG